MTAIGETIIIDGEEIVVKKYTKLEYEPPKKCARMASKSERDACEKEIDYEGWSRLSRRERNALGDEAFLDKD